jgi:asparagine synthase (glutamine-hydrolysing)
MCGITGIWRFRGDITDADRRDLKSATAALVHRGPDGEGYAEAGSAALGHRRLAILDPSEKAAQPMRTGDGLGILSYNGEVYNYLELRTELEREGVGFRSGCDTEVVLNALHQWGPKLAVPRFNGMFALAYHDHRSDRLWLARDRLGIKPLSMQQSDERLLFASEDKAILATGFRAEVDTHAMAMRMIKLNNANEHSLLRGIERLKPGTMLEITNASTQEHVYWQPLTALDPERIAADNTPESSRLSEIETAFIDSVRLHLASDAPLGACLSGGVDSGLITTVACIERGPLDAYVVDPDQGPNEAEDAARTAIRAGARLHKVSFDADSYLRLWPHAILAQESDGYVRSSPTLLALARQAKNDGIKVLLTGEGADELFGGYSRYRDSSRLWKRMDPPYSWFRSRKRNEKLLKRLRSAPFPDSLISVRPEHMRAMLAVIAPGATLRQGEIARHLSKLPRASDQALIAVAIYDLYSHLQELLNRHDRLGMAASIELRLPFLENRLIDIGIHLPSRYRLRHNIPKWLIKKMAEKYLPRENIYAEKRGFPIGSGYTEGLEPLLRDGLLRDVLRWSAAETCAVTESLASTPEARTRIIGAELFARIFAGGQSPDELGEKLTGLADRHRREES